MRRVSSPRWPTWLSLAEVPAEDQRHLVLGLTLGARHLGGVAREEEVARALPTRSPGLQQDLLLERRAHVVGQRLEARVRV
jgi:hypothetical protein